MKKKIMFAAIVAMAMVAVGKGTGAPAEDEVFVKFLEGYYLAPDAAEAIAKIPYFEKSVKKSRSATSPMSGFYFGVVKMSPERKNEWLAAKEATKNSSRSHRAERSNFCSSCTIKPKLMPMKKMGTRLQKISRWPTA